ncbi:MAG: hypothetical protein JO235_04130 [Chroococcidiopsidaceae cyanobacterium CP_BM_RX_35]|nr:hypothetical protein [Chroococcidiopsidaceae cyanobacterium CP_BM_RX_35]
MLDHLKDAVHNLSQNDDVKVIGDIAAASTAATAVLGQVTVATITVAAPGILGAIGLTAAAPVVVSAGGVVAVAGLVAFGVKKAVEMAEGNQDPEKDSAS